jgi:hypothetical protein
VYDLSQVAGGTTYHYRIVATTSAGSAVGPDRTFKTAAPKISSVQFPGARSNPTVTIVGSNFGTIPHRLDRKVIHEHQNRVSVWRRLQ